MGGSKGRRRNNETGAAPDPSEIVRAVELAVIAQLQEQLEEAMTEHAIDRGRLAGALGLTRAMVDHVLDSPDATLHDLGALAAVLRISFRVTRYASGV